MRGKVEAAARTLSLNEVEDVAHLVQSSHEGAIVEKPDVGKDIGKVLLELEDEWMQCQGEEERRERVTLVKTRAAGDDAVAEDEV